MPTAFSSFPIYPGTSTFDFTFYTSHRSACFFSASLLPLGSKPFKSSLVIFSSMFHTVAESLCHHVAKPNWLFTILVGNDSNSDYMNFSQDFSWDTVTNFQFQYLMWTWFKSWLFRFWYSSLLMCLGGGRRWPRWEKQVEVLASAWLNPGCCRNLGSEPADEA